MRHIASILMDAQDASHRQTEAVEEPWGTLMTTCVHSRTRLLEGAGFEGCIRARLSLLACSPRCM